MRCNLPRSAHRDTAMPGRAEEVLFNAHGTGANPAPTGLGGGSTALKLAFEAFSWDKDTCVCSQDGCRVAAGGTDPLRRSPSRKQEMATEVSGTTVQLASPDRLSGRGASWAGRAALAGLHWATPGLRVPCPLLLEHLGDVAASPHRGRPIYRLPVASAVCGTTGTTTNVMFRVGDTAREQPAAQLPAILPRQERCSEVIYGQGQVGEPTRTGQRGRVPARRLTAGRHPGNGAGKRGSVRRIP